MISHRGPQKMISLTPAEARVKLRPGVYLRRNPAVARDLVARFAVIGAGIVFWQWPLVLIGFVLLAWPILRYRRVARALHIGFPCAAKVISVDPPLVACVAEMSRVLNSSHPTLVIMSTTFAHESESVESGDRIALVGLPRGGIPSLADSLEAYVVSTVSAEPGALILEAVPEWHWDDLEDALFRVSHPYRPGVFPLT